MALFFTVENEIITAFYDDKIHGDKIPKGAKKISLKKHKELLQQQSQGAKLVYRKGVAQGYFEAPKLASIQQQKLMEVCHLTDREINRLKDSYPRSEIDSWAIQEQEANAYLNNANVATPLLDAMTKQRLISHAELAQKIIDKATHYKTYAGQLIGLRQQLEIQVNAASNVDSVKAIDISTLSSLAEQLRGA